MAEDIGSLAIKIALETAAFQAGMRTLKRNLEVLDSSFKSSIAGVKNWGTNVDSLKTQMENLGEKMNVQKNIIKQYSEQLDKSKRNLEANASKMMDLRSKVEAAKNAWQESTKTMGANATETVQLKEKYESLNKQYIESEQRVRNSSKAVEGYTIQLNNAKAKLKEMESQLLKANKEMILQNSQMIKLGDSLKIVGDKTRILGDGISSVGQTMSYSLTAPLIGIGAQIIKTGQEFDAQMSRVKAISGATGKDFEDLRNKAIQLGKDTAFSGTEAAQGMENLAAAGFSTTEILAAMPGMLSLAASSGTDIATSSDIAAAALRGFGLEASQAGHVADVIARAAADTAADVNDIGDAFKYAAPVAYSFGLSMEETAAAVGVMTDAGMRGEQAGTTLRAALTRLASPAKPAAEMMKALGFNAFDAHGKMLPLAKVIEQLQMRTKGLSDEKKADAISTIFGTEALSGMLNLMAAGPQKIDGLTTSFTNANGEAKKMADTMQGNGKGAVEEFRGSLEVLGVKIYDLYKNNLEGVIRKATEFVNRISNMNSATVEAGARFAGFAAAAGPILMVVGKIISLFGGGTSAIGGMSKKIGELEASASTKLMSFGMSTQRGLSNAKSAMNGFLQQNNIVSKGMNNIIKTVSGAHSKLNEVVKKGMDSVGNLFKSGFGKLPEFIGKPLEAVAGAVGSAGPKLFEAFTSVGGTAMDGLKLIIFTGLKMVAPAAIIGLLLLGLGVAQTELGTQLDTIFKNIIEKGPTLIQNFVNKLLTKIPVLIDAGVKLLDNFIKALTTNLPVILTGATKIVMALVEGVTRNLPKLIPMAIELISTILKAIIENLPTIIMGGLELLLGLIKGITDNMEKIVNCIVDVIKLIIKTITDNLPQIIEAAVQIVVALIQGLSEALPMIAAAAPELVEAIVKAFFSVNWLDVGWHIITGINEGLKSAAFGLAQSAVNAASGALTAVKNFLEIKSPSQKFKNEVGEMIPAGIALGIETGGGTVQTQLSKLANGLTVAPEIQAKMTTGLGANIGGGGQPQSAAQTFQPSISRVNETQQIVVPVNLDGRVIAEVVAANQRYIDRYNNRTVGGAPAW